MFVVRYAALLALVFWVGALGRDTVWAATTAHAAPLACGAALVLLLLVLKFVGPPPRSFFLRLALVLTMLALAAYGRLASSSPARVAQLAIGCVLLAFYARET